VYSTLSIALQNHRPYTKKNWHTIGLVVIPVKKVMPNTHRRRDATKVLSRRLKGRGLKERIAVNGYSISQLRDVTCHMGSHSVTCYPTQVNAPRLNPSH